MKQVIQNLRNGETSVVEVPLPVPKPGMVLVHTAASLVSAGTERMLIQFAEKSLLGKARSRPDLARQVLDKARREGLMTTIEAALNRLDQPMQLGYSSAGMVVGLGEGVKDFQVGQRVACAGGGYAVHAEYAIVPVNLLAPLPDQVDFESAAFTTLGAIALHGFRLAEPQIGERVAVIGLGLLGLLAAGIASAAGCQVLGIDLDPARIELAREMGVEAVLREGAQETATAFTRGRGCDVVLICADTLSSDPVELAGAIARDRGRVVAVGAVGLQIPRNIYYQKELSFVNSRSYGPGRYDQAYEEGGQDYPLGYVRWTEGRNLEAFVDLLASGRLDVRRLITHQFPIDQAAEAYELITGRRGEPFLGVVLTYPQAESQEVVASRIYTRSEDHRAIRSEASCKLGVLGAGNFANAVLLPSIRKISQVELVAITSGSGLNAQHAARKFGFHYAAGNETEVLHDADVNTIAILTRHNLHARQVIEAIEAGKHVFCEKPLALNRDELETIWSALHGSGGRILLMVGFNRRFAPMAVKLSEFLLPRQEPLLAHYRVNVGYLPPDHWLHNLAQGGGRIIGEGCHFVDFLTFLVGEPPVAVTAQAMPDAGRYQEDNVVLTFRFPDGSLGTVSYLANGDRAFPKERVEVFSGGRIAVLDDFRTLETIYQGKRQVIRSRLRQDKGHKAEWESFVDAIRAGGPPPIPYIHLNGVTLATFAAVEALRSGEKVVIS